MASIADIVTGYQAAKRAYEMAVARVADCADPPAVIPIADPKLENPRTELRKLCGQGRVLHWVDRALRRSMTNVPAKRGKCKHRAMEPAIHLFAFSGGNVPVIILRASSRAAHP